MIAEQSAIVARGMGVRRGGRWLLRPVDFGVSTGVVGVAGPPGTGKSSLLATFATLRRPHVGTLDVLGYDAENTTDLRSARARIGYLPHRFSGGENLTVREYVSYAAYYKCTSSTTISSAVRKALRRLDLTESGSAQMGLLPDDLRLRAGLAATCVNEPELVLLDEPLDGPEAMDLVPLITSLAPTVLVTASSAACLTGWCDRVFTMVRGRLTEVAGRPRTRPGPAARSRRPARPVARPRHVFHAHQAQPPPDPPGPPRPHRPLDPPGPPGTQQQQPRHGTWPVRLLASV